MAFPKKLLAPGEQIVLEANPNWSILAPRSAVLLLVVAVVVAVLVSWSHVPSWLGWLLLACVAAAVLWLLAKVMTWLSTRLVLTNMRVVYRAGVLKRIGREIPLDRVQDVTYVQSLFERMLGAGSLTIQSAGAGGEDPFPDIRHPARVQATINQLISQSSGSGGGLGGRRGSSPGYAQPQYQQPQQYPPQPQYQQAQQYPPQSQYQQPQYQQQQPEYAQPQPLQYAQPPHYPQQQPPGGYASESQTPQVPMAAVPASSTERMAHLVSMHEQGVITDAEFEHKRRELLGNG
ncbi:MAG: PH domain-containing protein [Acidimicrobiales bacterium]